MENRIRTSVQFGLFVTGETVQNIINDPDIELYKGDFTVIMGSSGSGKSTLLYALFGMDVPSSGQIWFSGEKFSSYDSDRLTFFVASIVGLYFNKTASLIH